MVETDFHYRELTGQLRLADPATGQLLLRPDEAWDRARRAEAEVARLRAELAHLRGETKVQ